MKRTILVIAGLSALAAGCAQTGQDVAAADSQASASALLRDNSGATRAQGTVSEVPGGLRVRLEASGLSPGTYAAHVHTTGRCDPPDFASAGPHWNPTSRQHGRDNPQGMHKGDLPNLMVGTDGRGSIEYVIPEVRLRGGDMAVLDADGAALVVHASADDYRTDPSGNSGGRIACGIIG